MVKALPAPSLTLADAGVQRLHSLLRALDYEAARVPPVEQVFRMLADSWGDAVFGGVPRWASDITDDCTPFEFSVAIDGETPELRFLVEVQGAAPSLSANWHAARAMNGRLATSFGVPLERLHAVEDLFAPTAETRRFTMWHAACFPRGGPPTFKIYLNPQARGWAEARSLVESAMGRLGFLGARLPAASPHEEICYFSLDLSTHREARVKVYTAHYNTSAEQVEAAISEAQGYVPGQAVEFCQALSGAQQRFEARPILTCLSFVQGSATPTTGTVHLPVRAYAHHDGIVRDRVLAYMPEQGKRIYQRTLEAFANRRLEDGVGMQTYVSLRQERGRRRLTVYLAPEIYDVGQSPMTQPKISGVVERLAGRHLWPVEVEDER
jgi:DMATS type aromatic prenyltransferase